MVRVADDWVSCPPASFGWGDQLTARCPLNRVITDICNWLCFYELIELYKYGSLNVRSEEVAGEIHSLRATTGITTINRMLIARNRTTRRRISSMTTRDQIFPTEALAEGEPTRTLSNWIRRIGRQIATWVDTCADYYAAAALYEQLSALSDTELSRRGLSRANLARDVLRCM